MHTSTLFKLLLLNAASLIWSLQYDCSRREYERCVKIADPLVKEVHLIFPDNTKDIDIVCRTWNSFVDCLKKYTDMCFTSQQRLQFNKAIENPIESVHQMCMQPEYQKEYLHYAPCMKSTVIDSAHCGPHYSLLVDQVDQGDIISKATLCCSHDRFKQCVIRETREMCDRGVPDGPAARFSMQIIDKALSFLQDQCYNYIPNSGDCTAVSTDNLPYNTMLISTSPSQYPWNGDMRPKQIEPSRVVPPRSTPTWLPSSSPDSTQFEATHSMAPQSLGSRTRPASYGRASSWADTVEKSTPVGVNSPGPSFNPSEVNTGASMNTAGYFDGILSTAPSKPAGATVSTWTIVNPSPGLEKSVKTYELDKAPDPTYSSSTTWYPAAGSQLSNEVEEPNQMGLVNNKNSQSRWHASVILVAATLCALTIL